MALHGHTKIELTNVNTEEVETYEDDNLVTNVIAEMLSPMGLGGNDIYNNLYVNNTNKDKPMEQLRSFTNGLLLFDIPLPEDPNQFFPLPGTKMTGMGSTVTYTGNNKYVGSYNNDESGFFNNYHGYKHVWDFSTHQGNGEISAACLTTAAGGKIGTGYYPYISDYRTDTYDIRANSTTYEQVYASNNKKIAFGDWSEKIVYFDGDNDIIITISVPNDGYFPQYNYNYKGNTIFKNDYKITFNLYHYPSFTNKFSIFDYYHEESSNSYTGCSLRLIKQIEIQLSELDSILTNSMKENAASNKAYIFCWSVSADNGYIYISFKPSSDIGGYNVKRSISPNEIYTYIWKINIEDFSYEYFNVINTTGKVLDLYAREIFRERQFEKDSEKYKSYYITNNNILIFGGSYGSFIIDFLNPLEAKEIFWGNSEEDENKCKITGMHDLFYWHGYFIGQGYFYNEGNYQGQGKNYSLIIDPEAKTIKYLNFPLTYAGGDGTNISGPYCFHFYNLFFKNRDSFKIIRVGNSNSVEINQFLLPNSLITINNLPTTLTKTEAQTMKVTYTIVEEEDT